MPESMTGFGAAQLSAAGLDVRAELRSVNHRHLDLRFRLPAELSAVQGDLTQLVRGHLDRGHVDVIVHVTRDADVRPEVQVDRQLAKAWHTALGSLAGELNLTAGPELSLIAAQPGVLSVARPEREVARAAPVVTEVVTAALLELVASRRAEGAALAVDIQERLATLRRLHSELSELAPQVVAAQRARLTERVARALADAGQQLDPSRVAQEVVLLSDKSDITEELVRLRGHLDAAFTALEAEHPGKRLGFLLQEILREFNTTGSKSGDVQITERVISAKVELEKIREQALNLA